MTELLAADSWLVVDGRARAVDRHWARFSAACAGHGVDTWAFRAEVEHAVPAEGRWFPRVELRADGELALQVRPAPPREPTVVAWIADVPDPRRAPRIKGPDLERLGACAVVGGGDPVRGVRRRADPARDHARPGHRARGRRGAAPPEPEGRKTWLVSALHGIRAVTRWVGGPEPGRAARAAEWQRRLESL